MFRGKKKEPRVFFHHNQWFELVWSGRSFESQHNGVKK
ncbi:hypothetical protein O23A_p4317 [Aeromonas salmonicida]|nr:hypothetical protein O23A_p4317 [Aeromonas salmonicida]